MKKRILAFMLSITMLMGIAPVSAMEVNATENDEIIAENITGNSFTDTTAQAGESYVYTIEGSDGSVQEITVLAESPEIVETGNRVVEETVTTEGSTEYVLASSYQPGETYVIVNKNDYALKSEGAVVSSQMVTVVENKIIGPCQELELTVNGPETINGVEYATIINKDGNYLVLNGNNASFSTSETTVHVENLKFYHYIPSYDSVRFKSSGGYYLSSDDTGVSYTNSTGNSTKFDLYIKQTTGSGSSSETKIYTIDTAGLDALITECDALSSRNYTAESWSNFKTALANAKNVRAALAESYDTAEDANAALEEVDAAHNALLAAKNALQQSESSGTTATVDLTWQRTLENTSTSYDDDGDLLNDVEYILETDDGNYSLISWKNKAQDILDLTTNPNMTVWDYGTNSQYATGIPQVADVQAATWNEHAQDESAWRIGTVRRFTGTFTWPEGFDVEDSIVYKSVNDDNYSEIYAYINNNPDLKERFGTSKVFPVNDDMFVFIHKANDPLTVDNYLEHMLFWSGTSGKGLWSVNYDGGGGDWDRTTPATFNGVNALPAYRGIMPNNNDISGEQATVGEWNITTMKHSDNWYTLVDSNVMMSTVKRIYGVEDLSNQEMVIEIFCFDNSGNGGMDKVNLHFEKIPETTTTVQINYYLDSVLASNFIGSSLMSGIDDGEEITLLSGTTVNELDYYRFAAATKAGTVVSNGVQQDAVPYVVDIDKEYNIINVVYTSNNADDKVYYFYDFGVENQYVYTPKEDAVLNQNYKITKVENSDSRIKASISDDKKTVLLSYTPMNSEGEVASGILKIQFNEAYEAEVKPIVIAPASNTLFEEGFMSPAETGKYAEWVKGGTVDATVVTDNETTVFGYTDSYKTSIGESGTYTSTVNGQVKFTENFEFKFGGTGFDLIGTCGPNTGTISVRVINSSGAAVKNYLVDTSFTDTTDVVGEGTTLYQVPLIQAKDLPEDIYTVRIMGAYIVYNSTSSASTYSVYGAESVGENDPIADVYELLDRAGMTEEDIDSLEYINMGRLMGTSTYAATTVVAETTAAPEEMIIELDGFRSYRATNYKYYPTEELGVIYYNILDCVNGSFAAYIETKADGTYQVNDYELSGGPQNEIYLTANNGNNQALTIGKTNSISKQVSLRSVDGEPVTVNVNGGDGWTNGKTITLNHTTEMYYEVPANEEGHIVIQVVDGFLGIGNLKLTSGDPMQAAEMSVELIEDDYELVVSAMKLYASGDAPDSDIGKPEGEKPDKDESKPEKPEDEKPGKDESKPEKPEGEKPDKGESEPEKPNKGQTEQNKLEAEETDREQSETKSPEVETPVKEMNSSDITNQKKEQSDKGTPNVEESTESKTADVEKAEAEEAQKETLDVKNSDQETADAQKEQTENATLDKCVRFGVWVAVILMLVLILVILWKKHQNMRRKRRGGKR